MSDEHDHDEEDEDGRPFCTARTRGGQGPRCKNRATPGHDRCASHRFKVPGRPSKLTPRLRDAILLEVLDGAYLETAAQAVGVNKTTLYRWLRRADDVEARALEHVDDDDVTLAKVYDHADPAEWVYLDFRHALKSAEAAAELEAGRMLKALAFRGGKWQALGFWLERRYPDRWRRRESHQVDHTGELRRTVEVIVPTDEERGPMVARLQAAGALPAADGNPANSGEDVDDDPHS